MSAVRHRVDIGAQKQTFDKYWDQFSMQVAQGNGVVDFPDPTERKPQYVTTVVRIPAKIGTELQRCVKRIQTEYPGHYYYPESDLHFTMINLDQLFARIDTKAIDIVNIAKILQQTLLTLPPLEIELRGLGIFPTTIFAQAYDTSGTIELYRETIKQTIARELGCTADSVTALVRGIAFVNLIRFRYLPEPELAQLLTTYRDTYFGAFNVDNIQLVKTDRLLSKENTTIY